MRSAGLVRYWQTKIRLSIDEIRGHPNGRVLQRCMDSGRLLPSSFGGHSHIAGLFPSSFGEIREGSGIREIMRRLIGYGFICAEIGIARNVDSKADREAITGDLRRPLDPVRGHKHDGIDATSHLEIDDYPVRLTPNRRVRAVMTAPYPRMARRELREAIEPAS